MKVEINKRKAGPIIPSNIDLHVEMSFKALSKAQRRSSPCTSPKPSGTGT